MQRDVREKNSCQCDEQTNERGKGQKHKPIQFFIEGGYLIDKPHDIDLIGFDSLIEILMVIAVSFLRRFHA